MPLHGKIRQALDKSKLAFTKDPFGLAFLNVKVSKIWEQNQENPG
jgi:hypothetical protein